MSWSDDLIEQTREALNEPVLVLDEFLHMKHFDDGYGKIHINDLLMKKWLIQDKETGDYFLYNTVDELIAAGWAID